MSLSTILTSTRGFVRSSAFLAASLAITVVPLGASAFADGKSLEETGGYVPTGTPALAFKNITLADLGVTVFPSVSKGGGYAGGEARVPILCRTEVKNGDVLQSVSYLAQWFDDGWLKCAKITFTDGVGGVYAQTVSAKYIGSQVEAAYGTDFAGGTVGSVTDSTSGEGYGFHSLALHTAADIDSISINFNDSEATKLTPRTTLTAVGPGDYAVMPYGWSQMLGTNNNTLNGVTAVGDDDEIFYASVAANVTITGTRGTWAYSGYTGASDVRYGYIDEASAFAAPTVTIANIPFDYYKVVFVPSTDTGDARFGYISVNGVNYSSDNTEKATDKDYETVVNSTTAWGKTQIANYLHGVNYLVTPVLANNSGKTLTVAGHRGGDYVRGCIAAIQIVKAEAPDTLYSVTATGDVTWSTKAGLTVNSGTWASGNTIMLVNNLAAPVTVTFDEEVEAAEFILSGSGTTTIAFTDAAYNKIGSFNLGDVSGEVAIGDAVSASSITAMPITGSLRFAGTATLGAIPFNGSVADGAYIIDQPMTTGMDFLLEGKKALIGIDGDRNYSFARFVIANSASVQNVEQYGGNITVTGNVVPYSNQASVFFGHYSGSTSTMKTLGGTFTATSAAASLGWDGAFAWTIGDGVSANNTAVVTLPGVVSGGNRGGYTRTRNADLILNKGGTLAIGPEGIQMLSGNTSTLTLAGGTLKASADTFTMNTSSGTTVLSSGTDTIIDTETYTLTVSNVVSGAGSLTKTGLGTLVLASSATATGTLTVDAGTLTLDDGVTWAGTISVGANGTLDVTDTDVSVTETVYIPVGGTIELGEGATVKLNGAAIDTDTWELSGGTFINKTLKTAVTTATGDFTFQNATWQSALGEGTQIDWAGSLSEVRIHANNAAPAVATVDVTAAQVKTFAVDGTGDLAFAADNGGITASAYDFSEATGRVEYDLSTGDAPVTSGSNTLILGGGSGTPTVAAGRTLTLGPWGTTDESGLTNTYSWILRPATGSTIVFSPGEGRVQKTAGFGNSNTSTTIAVTNGTLVVDLGGEGTSKFFGRNSVRIDNGGVVSLESQDALGWSNADDLTINKGGTLVVKVRDTLKRTVAFNGGTIELYGANSSRALDLYGNTINVNDDSSIEQMESQSVIYLRNNLTTVNVADGKTLSINANIYVEGGNSGNKLLFQAASGALSQNGVVVLNGYSGDAKQYFNNETTVGTSGRAVICELNCEHQNGIYTVNAASRLRGTGSITGNGGVTLAAANSKLCGALTVNNLTAASGGTYGDQWNAVAAKVATSYFAAGTQSIENGSFTIGADCIVTNSEGTVDTTAATFSIAANGNLKLEKSVTVAGLTVANGGTITLVAESKNSVPVLNVAGDTSFAGDVNFIMDFGSASAPGSRTFTLMTGSTLPNLANVSVSDGRGEKKWKVFVDGGALKASSSGSFALRLR